MFPESEEDGEEWAMDEPQEDPQWGPEREVGRPCRVERVIGLALEHVLCNERRIVEY